MTSCRLVDRPRLLQRVAQRWTRRVVTVTAGPGFGKSTLLSQAAGENALAPRGVEIVLQCTGRDRWAHHFLCRLADAVGIDTNGAALTTDRITTELGRRWPTGVCLVVDDVHHLTATRDGERLLGRLVGDAPPSVHFLLAGRRRVRGMSRLRAMGEIEQITESDLALDADETRHLADAHDVDPTALQTTGGWPAVAAVAATYGITGATEYVWEAVLDHLDPAERRVLAVAAALGRCDAALLAATVEDDGIDPGRLLAALPMVHETDADEFVVHDLWNRVVDGVLDTAAMRAAMVRAVGTLIGRRDNDRAFAVCANHGLWDHVDDVLRACCARGYADARPHVLACWLDQLPDDRLEQPSGVLLRGLVARSRDPFGAGTVELLRRAAECHRAIGDVTGEVTALNELVFVLRNQGRCHDVPKLALRIAELHAAGHREAEGSMALFHSVLAESAGDSVGTIAALDALPVGSLSRDWLAIVEFRRATAQLTLGDEAAMMLAANRCAELAEGTTMRHVVPLSQWFTGDPRPALAAAQAIIADATRTRVDGVALGAFATMLLASSGRVGEASTCLTMTERAGEGGAVAPLMRGYLTGVQALVAAADHRDDDARQILTAALSATPLTDPVGWMMATRWLALAYVLVPDCRSTVDSQMTEPLHRRRVAVARAVARAREGRAVTAESLAGITPGIVATTVPLPWAMTLASRLADGGEPFGRDLAEWLFDVFGAPARDALRRCGDPSDAKIAAGARKLLAGITLAPRRRAHLHVLGPSELSIGTQPAGPDWSRERVRSLLLFLVLNGPSRRDRIIDALWPDLDLDAADRNLRVTLTYLQRLLEPERQRGEAPFFVRQQGATLSLAGAPHLAVDVDDFMALLDDAADADRRGVPSLALGMLERALDLWRDPCLVDVLYEEWAQPFCRQLDERFVRAAVRAGELYLAAGDLAAARHRARRALTVDPWFEAAHRVLIAASLTEHDHAGAARLLDDCDGKLAELGVPASAQTEMLRRRLHTRSSGSATARRADHRVRSTVQQ